VTVHDLVLEELVEWFEDVAGGPDQASIEARCVVVPVGTGWGRTTLLAALVDHVNTREDIAGLALVLAGSDAPVGLVLQATWLPLALAEAREGDAVSRALGVDTLRGLFDRSLGFADALGLLGGRAGSLGALLLQVGVDAAWGREGTEESRKLAEVGRLAVRVAKRRVSTFLRQISSGITVSWRPPRVG
jgi:hypothetical protein